MKNVVITGAGRGLARYILQLHLEAGDRVLGLVRSISDEMAALVEEFPEQLFLGLCEVTDEAQTAAVGGYFEEMAGEGEKADIIYNVAGISPAEHRTVLADTDLSMDAMGLMYEINSVGPMRVCKSLLPYIKEGTLVMNISSEAGSIGGCGRMAEYGYCMSKAALNMGTKLLNNDITRYGARALAIHPGWVRTDMGGPEAAASSESVSPEESAAGIYAITQKISEIPAETMYLDFTGKELLW